LLNVCYSFAVLTEVSPEPGLNGLPCTSPESSLPLRSARMGIAEDGSVVCTIHGNLVRSKGRSPLNRVVAYPVMRLAGQAPVSYRWMETYPSAVPFQSPPSWLEGGHHFDTTSTAAVMRGGRILHRYVNDAVREPLRNSIDKLSPKLRYAGHWTKSLLHRRLLAIV
jgi:hypothetical protein